MEFKITGGIVVLIDEEDYDLVHSFNKWKLANGYPQSRKMVQGKTSYTVMHRLIMNAPKNMQVDHINGNKLDNRKVNLRLCTHASNSKNRPIDSTNTNGFKGVWKHHNLWRARITSDGVTYNLGSYPTIEEAALAYNEAAIKYHGEYARLNTVHRV